MVSDKVHPSNSHLTSARTYKFQVKSENNSEKMYRIKLTNIALKEFL